MNLSRSWLTFSPRRSALTTSDEERPLGQVPGGLMKIERTFY